MFMFWLTSFKRQGGEVVSLLLRLFNSHPDVDI